MNNMAQVQKINERELELGITGEASWHAKYKDSAWVYVGGLANELSEGDLICVLSQWGEVEDFNYPRDAKTGKPRGWCWCKYEDQRSTILCVDNMNGAKLLQRTLRVDHCEKYKLPPELRDKEEAADGHYGPEGMQSKYAPGAAYAGKELASSETLQRGVDVFAPAGDSKKDSKHRVDDWRALKPEEAVARAAKAAKKEKKKKKDSKKDSKKDPKKPSKKRKRAAEEEEEEDDGLLPYRPEPLPDAQQAPLVPQGRQGEVVAASWRGEREPGAPVAFRGSWGKDRKDRGPPPPRPSRSYAEIERERNKSYGGMNRAR
mmetsp:Transcript_1458/g.4400  ORF Transcript_1458/g.4400 Transcript_1458/m.4400 type:complete len:317 (+) Transcript_1458:198-1148(+)